jgi:hypothetical protein
VFPKASPKNSKAAVTPQQFQVLQLWSLNLQELFVITNCFFDFAQLFHQSPSAFYQAL